MTYLALALCASAISGCAGIDTKPLLLNLQGCERHYDGVVSAGLGNTGFTGKIRVDCTPAPQTAAPQPTSVAPNS